MVNAHVVPDRSGEVGSHALGEAQSQIVDASQGVTAVIIRAARVAEVDVVTNLVEDHDIVVRVVVIRGPAQVDMPVQIVVLRAGRAFARGPVQCKIQGGWLTGEVLDVGLGVLGYVEDVECPCDTRGDGLYGRGSEVYVGAGLVVRVYARGQAVDCVARGWRLPDGLVEQPLVFLGGGQDPDSDVCGRTDGDGRVEDPEVIRVGCGKNGTSRVVEDLHVRFPDWQIRIDAGESRLVELTVLVFECASHI